MIKTITPFKSENGMSIILLNLLRSIQYSYTNEVEPIAQKGTMAITN